MYDTQPRKSKLFALLGLAGYVEHLSTGNSCFGASLLISGAEKKGWVHNIFACVALQPKVNVNAYCNARIEKISIPTLHCIATHVQINLCALLVNAYCNARIEKFLFLHCIALQHMSKLIYVHFWSQRNTSKILWTEPKLHSGSGYSQVPSIKIISQLTCCYNNLQGSRQTIIVAFLLSFVFDSFSS